MTHAWVGEIIMENKWAKMAENGVQGKTNGKTVCCAISENYFIHPHGLGFSVEPQLTLLFWIWFLHYSTLPGAHIVPVQRSKTVQQTVKVNKEVTQTQDRLIKVWHGSTQHLQHVSGVISHNIFQQLLTCLSPPVKITCRTFITLFNSGLFWKLSSIRSWNVCST